MSSSSFFSRVRSKWRSLSLTDPKGLALIFGTIGYCGGLYITVNHVVFCTLCIGPSMIPSIDERGEFALVDVFDYKFRKKKFLRGDIIISRCPYDTDKTICKRILATEGDIVINNLNFPEVRVSQIPKDHVWLAGDNPQNSTDSRHYGAVPVALLRGRVFYKKEHGSFKFHDVEPNQEYEATAPQSAMLLDAKDKPELSEKVINRLPQRTQRELLRIMAILRPERFEGRQLVDDVTEVDENGQGGDADGNNAGERSSNIDENARSNSTGNGNRVSSIANSEHETNRQDQVGSSSSNSSSLTSNSSIDSNKDNGNL